MIEDFEIVRHQYANTYANRIAFKAKNFPDPEDCIKLHYKSIINNNFFYYKNPIESFSYFMDDQSISLKFRLIEKDKDSYIGKDFLIYLKINNFDVKLDDVHIQIADKLLDELLNTITYYIQSGLDVNGDIILIKSIIQDTKIYNEIFNIKQDLSEIIKKLLLLIPIS